MTLISEVKSLCRTVEQLLHSRSDEFLNSERVWTSGSVRGTANGMGVSLVFGHLV